MAFSTLTVKLIDASTVTKTIVSDSLIGSKEIVSTLCKQGGLFDDVGVFHPTSSILDITIS